jgi:nucleoid-associated protein YgaU
VSPGRQQPRRNNSDDEIETKSTETSGAERKRPLRDIRKLKSRPKSAPTKTEYKVIKVHKLGKNETWTHLAAKYYGNTTEPYWRHIYEFNKEMVGDNYKRIWGGMEIKIPELPDELKKKDK